MENHVIPIYRRKKDIAYKIINEVAAKLTVWTYELEEENPTASLQEFFNEKSNFQKHAIRKILSTDIRNKNESKTQRAHINYNI